MGKCYNTGKPGDSYRLDGSLLYQHTFMSAQCNTAQTLRRHAVNKNVYRELTVCRHKLFKYRVYSANPKISEF